MYEELAAKIVEKGLSWEELEGNLFRVSLVCPHRLGAAKFFYDFVTRSLAPGKILEVVTHFATQYRDLTVAELIVKFENRRDLQSAKENWPFLEKEILLGVSSFYHAKKILELRGLSFDEKASFVQEKMGLMMRRFPQHFESDIFHDMQHLFLASSEQFKKMRLPQKLSRIIFTLYLFRKSLERRMAKNPERRHLSLKCKQSFLHSPFGLKPVLSLYVGLSFLKEHEVFEAKHLHKALLQVLPGACVVPDSYLVFDDAGMRRFYIEVEREEPFSKEEITGVDKWLPSEIRARIEHLVSPIFMPRNEEEVMRNILTLAGQLKFLRDIPQMMISFQKQMDNELIFTVTLVRILHNALSIVARENLSIDRVKTVGYLRKKYPKEATVLRISIPTRDFIREDFSVDLFAARMQVVREMEELVGEVRDYNGGMIAKQSENFTKLKDLLGPVAEKSRLLLQNFFHSISPVSLSATFDPKLLKILFERMLQAEERVEEIGPYVFGVFVGEAPFEGEPSDFLRVQMEINDIAYTGLILLSPDPSKKNQLLTFAKDPSYLEG